MSGAPTIGPFLPADWPAPPGVRAFTTLRHGAGASRAPFDTFNLGNRTAADGDDPATVEANRAELVRLAGLPAAPHWLKQVHGTEVVRVAGPGDGREPIADAAVTAVPGTVLAILTAGRRLVDATDPARAPMVLPDERNGLLLVFRTFERVSYALVLDIKDSVRVGDRLVNPR